MKKVNYILILVILVGFSPLELSALDRYCNSCYKKIDGQYLEVDGHFYHTNHFTCTNCLGPITATRFYERDGKYYDSACFANFITKKCEYCGKPILGEAVYLNSKTYHTECYNNHAGMRCIVCKNVVSMSFYVDKQGNAVCKDHQPMAQKCFSCQRYMSPKISEDGREYDDGRVMCFSCLETAIDEADHAEDLIKEIKWQLESYGIVIDEKFELSFVPMDELDKNFNDYTVDHLGVTVYENSKYLGGLFSSKKYDIKILYGLPKSQLREVLAHELMHVWLFKNAPQPQEPQLCEGSCQYAAYLILQNDTTKDGAYFLNHLLNQSDSVYGMGFQNVSAYIKKNGVPGWLEYLKKNKQAPW